VGAQALMEPVLCMEGRERGDGDYAQPPGATVLGLGIIGPTPLLRSVLKAGQKKALYGKKDPEGAGEVNFVARYPKPDRVWL